jgi:hypothetical protein
MVVVRTVPYGEFSWKASCTLFSKFVTNRYRAIQIKVACSIPAVTIRIYGRTRFVRAIGESSQRKPQWYSAHHLARETKVSDRHERTHSCIASSF